MLKVCSYHGKTVAKDLLTTGSLPFGEDPSYCVADSTDVSW